MLQRWTWSSIVVTAIVCCGSGTGFGQNPQVQRPQASFPTITFSVANWGRNPSQYSIAIDSTGNTTYEATPDSVQRTGDPYTVEFIASESTRTTVFRLAERLHYFGGQDSGQNGAAQGGVHTLTFRDAKSNHSISYGASGNRDVQQLTAIFQEIAATLEYGRRLSLLRQHPGPELRAELRRMEGQAKRKQLREIQAVAPVLQAITSDARVEQEARSRAAALLALSSTAVS
jgi:hypothetical protein